MGSVSIDLSLSNIWGSWFKFKRGKKSSREIEWFNYYLENNLHKLCVELNNERYKHSGYRNFIVIENKQREISVASVRDRVVHRLLYEYLVEIYDKTFIFDVWSCRKGKGLLEAIERAQKFLKKYSDGYVWRADVKKFFDNIDHDILTQILSFRTTDNKAIKILKEVIGSYSTNCRERVKGVPIGNLTSQIFANIYLNELDRFVKHFIKPQAYLRYGDDFIIISENLDQLKQIREKTTNFLRERLQLKINAKNDIMIKTKWGLKFLGVWIFPKGRKLNKRNWRRAREKVNARNVSSYSGLVKQHSKQKRIKEFNWIILEKSENN